MSKAKIGLIGAVYFIGWTAACIFLNRFPDIYGRKWFTLSWLILMFFIILAIVLIKNVNAIIVLMFFLGLTPIGRVNTLFIWLSEMVPLRW